MPYVSKRLRNIFDPAIATLLGLLKGWRHSEFETGPVVYVLFRLLVGLYAKGPFTVRAEALKVLEATKLEYYRRVMAPYEDKKIEEEGDIDGL